MADYITLLGAEDVRSASHTMQRAANDFNHAVGSLDDTLQRHRQFMDAWLDRLETVLKRTKEDSDG